MSNNTSLIQGYDQTIISKTFSSTVRKFIASVRFCAERLVTITKARMVSALLHNSKDVEVSVVEVVEV